MDLMKEKKIAVVGLGYVGLPLAVEFAKKYATIGFDINATRVKELMNCEDKTLELSHSELSAVLVSNEGDNNSETTGLTCTTELNDVADCNVFIITVPTPTDRNHRPVLTPLKKASESVGTVLKNGDIVIYESTVYPGVTEEECIPILEGVSQLRFNTDFFVGYSPERINPGDKKRTVSKILKVTSGSTPEAAVVIDALYKSIIEAGTHLAPSIKVAEAAKVIENSQRDINIAFVNELSKIFNNLGIDTNEVLEAAGTKWNFLPFRPGLVGGHCISVDPYYLAQKAQETGYHPEIILSGRRLNDGMGRYVAGELVKLLIKRELPIVNSKVLMLGLTFKENCPDIRNTRSIDVYNELKSFNLQVDVYDPWANPLEVKKEFNLDLTPTITTTYDAVILTVAHAEFLQLPIRSYLKKLGVVYDVKSALDKSQVDGRL
tara:strand:- start:277 stop:1578 length:1302 start_codon:yes stop_codon:yes gene_type:complete